MDPELLQEMVRRGLLSPNDAEQQLQAAPPAPVGAPPPAEAPPSVKGGIDAVGAGLAKGAIAGTVGLPGDLEQLAQWGYGKATGKEPWEAKVPFKSEDIYKSLAGALHKSQNAQERYLEAGAEGAAALANPFGLVGKGKLLGKGAMTLGGLMGVGSEAGREMFPENPAIGGVLGASAPQMAKILMSSPSLALKVLSMAMPAGALKQLFNRPIWTGSITTIADALLHPKGGLQNIRRQSAIQQAAPELPEQQ